MVEWHVTPDYIVNNWTDELLNLMVDKLAERKKRESSKVPVINNRKPGTKVVSDTELFAQMGNKVKVTKHVD